MLIRMHEICFGMGMLLILLSLLTGCAREESKDADRQTETELKRLSKANQEMSQKYVSVVSDIAELAGRSNTYDQKLSDLTHDSDRIGVLERDDCTLSARLSEAEKKLEELRSALGEITEQAEDLDARMTVADRNAQSAADQALRLSGEVAETRNAGAAAGAQEGQVIENLGGAVDRLAAAVESANRDIETLSAELSRLTARIQTLEREGLQTSRIEPAPRSYATSEDIEVQYLDRIERSGTTLTIIVEGTVTNASGAEVSMATVDIEVKRLFGCNAAGLPVANLTMRRLNRSVEYRNMRPGETRPLLVQIPYEYPQTSVSGAAAVQWRAELKISKQVRN